MGENRKMVDCDFTGMILAQKLKLELISPPDDLLMSLSDNWLKREVRLSNISGAEKFCYPCFIKPLVPKIFTARKYSSYEDLRCDPLAAAICIAEATKVEEVLK